MNMEQTLIRFFKREAILQLGGVIAFLIVVGLMVAFTVNSLNSQAQERILEDRLQITGLGMELVFPEGWSPVDCQSGLDSTYNGCQWVCVSHDRIYRYCQPTVKAAGQ